MKFSNAWCTCEHHERVRCDERFGLGSRDKNSCWRCSMIQEMIEKHQQAIWEVISPVRWPPDGVWRDFCSWFVVMMMKWSHGQLWSLIRSDHNWSQLTMSDDMIILCVYRATFDEQVVWQVKLLLGWPDEVFQCLMYVWASWASEVWWKIWTWISR